MSVWLESSRATVAFVSGAFVVRLMIARRVQATCSSQSRSIVRRSASSFAEIAAWLCACAARAWWCSAIGAASPPLECARAMAAVEAAITVARASGSRRRVDVIGKSFRRMRAAAQARCGVDPVGAGPARALTSAPSVQALDEHRHALAAADAHRLEADRPVERLQVVEQRVHDPRARHAIRVAERDRAAVRVELLAERVDPDLAADR